MARRKATIPNPVSSAREILMIVREMSFDDLHDAASRVPRVAIIGPTIDDARRSALEIFGETAPARVVAQTDSDLWPDRADIVLVDSRTHPRRGSWPEVVIDFAPDESVQRIRQSIVRAGSDLELALGRHFPVLRQAAAMHVINTTARVNAQFALVSNIPALVPVIGGVLSAGADTIVLTKNQLMMIYKLAAIHGRDIDNRFRIYQEMVPVVGAGLFWRTVARDLAALIPFAAGAVPKVAIAFAGSIAAGMGAHVYYVEGKRVNGERMRQFYQQALEELRERPGLLRSLPGGSRSDPDEAPADAATVVDVNYRTDASSGMP